MTRERDKGERLPQTMEMPQTDWTPVRSSNLEAVRHDPETGTLAVRFKGGGVYDYAGVPTETYREFLAAPSLGSFLHARIKPHHPATRRRAL